MPSTTPITFAKREIVLTASIGLITWTSAQTSAEDMVKDAELAMHQAKRFGGDRIEPFRPAFRTVGTDRLQFESDLRRAIERREFTLAYQPIVRLEDGSVAGFEALLRWDHPRRGMIPPGDFIPVAESCGLIVQLGLFAMQQAAEDLADWQKQIGDAPLSVSVNLSSRQLIRRDLVSDVRSVIARANLKPRCFRLELTESLVMDNPEQTAHVLTKLKQLGIGLSLDDFGTGYSSLSYLTRFPFDTIKIDKSFVDDTTPKREVLLKSMVNMAHELGMSVVAEGIPTRATRCELRQMGCEYVQSFMFGPPMAGDAVLKTPEGAVSARSGVTGDLAEPGQIDSDRCQDAVILACRCRHRTADRCAPGRSASRSRRSRSPAGRSPSRNSRAPSSAWRGPRPDEMARKMSMVAVRQMSSDTGSEDSTI